MPSMDEYAKAPVAVRLKRLERTPAELAGAVRGQSEAALARRPDPKLSFDPATPDRRSEERRVGKECECDRRAYQRIKIVAERARNYDSSRKNSSTHAWRGTGPKTITD